jgi:hypothetical protein
MAALNPRRSELGNFGTQTRVLILFLDFVHPETLAVVDSTLNQKFHLVEKHVVPAEEPVTVDLYDHN